MTICDICHEKPAIWSVRAGLTHVCNGCKCKVVYGPKG